MVIAELGARRGRRVQAYLADPALRASVAVCDLAPPGAHRQRPLQRVRLLRVVPADAYGVKLLPAAAFTMGLIDRGILSLGMG